MRKAGAVAVFAAFLSGNAMSDENPKNVMGNVTNNHGIVTQGQIGNNTLNIGATARHLNSEAGEPLKRQMLNELPRDKQIRVMALMGDAESYQFALEIQAFLKAHGFKVGESDNVAQATFVGLVKGLSVQERKDGVLEFIVGANLK